MYQPETFRDTSNWGYLHFVNFCQKSRWSKFFMTTLQTKNKVSHIILGKLRSMFTIFRDVLHAEAYYISVNNPNLKYLWKFQVDTSINARVIIGVQSWENLYTFTLRQLLQTKNKISHIILGKLRSRFVIFRDVLPAETYYISWNDALDANGFKIPTKIFLGKSASPNHQGTKNVWGAWDVWI